MRIGLALGGGGLTGTAFHAGVLTALADHFDAREAEIIVGTSAGSTAAALMRSGFPPKDYVARRGRAADVRRGEGHPRRDAAFERSRGTDTRTPPTRVRGSLASDPQAPLEIPSGSCPVSAAAGRHPADGSRGAAAAVAVRGLAAGRHVVDRRGPAERSAGRVRP
ncbi:MAG: patatin-like phospholipase family protein [Candidatus Nanopelagicales bacterium]